MTHHISFSGPQPADGRSFRMNKWKMIIISNYDTSYSQKEKIIISNYDISNFLKEVNNFKLWYFLFFKREDNKFKLWHFLFSKSKEGIRKAIMFPKRLRGTPNYTSKWCRVCSAHLWGKCCSGVQMSNSTQIISLSRWIILNILRVSLEAKYGHANI